MDVFLETERMVLRRFTMSDVDVVLALDSDPAVRAFVEDGEPVDRDTVTHTIRHWLGWYQRSEVFGFWAAVEKGTGRFLGWFHFWPPPDAPPDQPELGYRLVSSVWGQGYATEGSRALIDRPGFQGYWSRRITDEHRLVYRTTDDQVRIAACRYHYEG
jgi:Txe/YoeB family toxin of toxin-antitoxin system